MGARRGRTDAVLDRESPVPLYYQLAQNMETAIRQGRLSSGSHLENEIELARQLRVSRPTVRRAIALLANRGLVIRRHGIGTLVVVGLWAALFPELRRIDRLEDITPPEAASSSG